MCKIQINDLETKNKNKDKLIEQLNLNIDFLENELIKAKKQITKLNKQNELLIKENSDLKST